MNSGFFVAGVSGQMAQQKMDDISHNLANANTVGFIGSRSSFETVFTSKASPTGSPETVPAAFQAMGGQFVDTRSGNIEQTGNDFDFAILGKAWFRVQTAPGEEAYTRAGNFTQDAEGNLLTQDGKPVLDAGGTPIQLPAGRVEATDQGELLVNGSVVAQLGLVSITDPAGIERIGNVLVKTPLTNTAPATDVMVRQGALESSNVNSVLAMTEMIATLRSYEATIKMIEEYNQQSSQLTSQVGMVQGGN